MCLFDQNSSDLKMDLFGGHFLLYDVLRCVRFSIGSQPIVLEQFLEACIFINLIVLKNSKGQNKSGG